MSGSNQITPEQQASEYAAGRSRTGSAPAAPGLTAVKQSRV